MPPYLPSYISAIALWGQGQKRGRVFEIVLGAAAALGFAPFYVAPLTLIAIYIAKNLHLNLGLKQGGFLALVYF